VDVVAPGADIHTTFLGDDYGAVHGTSLSSAFVSGLAGLLRSHYPDWSADMVRAQITHTAQNIDSLNPGFAGLLGSGRVNAYQALSVPPQPLLSFHSQTLNGSVTARPEPGSSVDLVVSVYNDWADASSVQGTLSSSSPYITITTANAQPMANIPAYATSANVTIPFRFNISSNAPVSASLSSETAHQRRRWVCGGYPHYHPSCSRHNRCPCDDNHPDLDQ
jgi:serine protease